MELVSFGIQNIAGAIPALLQVCFAAISLASAITALTPTPRDDVWVGRAYKILEAIALNVGAAKQAPPNKTGGRFVPD